MSKPIKFNYSYYVLVLTTLIYSLVVGTERMCLPVLFPEISRDLHLSVAQLGIIWGLDPLAGVFIGMIAGIIIDRFGIRVCLATVCFLGGAIGALRGLSVNFLSIAGLTFFSASSPP